MLRLYTATFKDRKPIELYANSILDAKWRLRDILGQSRLPTGTIIVPGQVEKTEVCFVKPEEITVAIEEIEFSVADNMHPFIRDLTSGGLVKDVSIDPLRVTYKIPDGASVYSHTLQMESHIKQIWRKYAREVDRESLEVPQKL